MIRNVLFTYFCMNYKDGERRDDSEELLNNLIVAPGDHTRLNSARDCCTAQTLIYSI